MCSSHLVSEHDTLVHSAVQVIVQADCGGQICERAYAEEISNCSRVCHTPTYCPWDRMTRDVHLAPVGPGGLCDAVLLQSPVKIIGAEGDSVFLQWLFFLTLWRSIHWPPKKVTTMVSSCFLHRNTPTLSWFPHLSTINGPQIIWQCVKTLYPCSSHQNSWYINGCSSP